MVGDGGRALGAPEDREGDPAGSPPDRAGPRRTGPGDSPPRPGRCARSLRVPGEMTRILGSA